LIDTLLRCKGCLLSGPSRCGKEPKARHRCGGQLPGQQQCALDLVTGSAMAETGQGAWTSSDAQKNLVKALVLGEQAQPNGARSATEHAVQAIKQLGFDEQFKNAIKCWIDREGLVPEDDKTTSKFRGYVVEGPNAKAPEAQYYASKLFPFPDGGERRFEDHPLAIQHADQPTDDPKKLEKKWNDYMYGPGMNNDKRRNVVRDTAHHSWSYHTINGGGPTAIKALVAARAHPEPWKSQYYDGQRCDGQKNILAGSKKSGDDMHERAEKAWRKNEAFSHKGPPKKTVTAERKRLRKSEAAAVQIAEGAVRLATLDEIDADRDRFRLRKRATARSDGVNCWICARNIIDCGRDVDDHLWGGARRFAPCGDVDNTGVVSFMDIVRAQGMEREQTRLFGQSLFALMKRPGPYPRKAVAIADEARRVARAAKWTTKAAVLNSKSALEERSDRLKRKAREAARRSPKKQRPSPKKVPPARIIRDDDEDEADAAPPPPPPGPEEDEFDEALAEAKRAVGALARFADDKRARSARAELLNALTGFGI
jgi:hypothetical protein